PRRGAFLEQREVLARGSGDSHGDRPAELDPPADLWLENVAAPPASRPHPRTPLRRVVVLAPEPVRPRMAGMGIRALELARALGGEFDVRLLVPNNGSDADNVAPDVKVSAVASGRLATAAEGADAAVVSGHAANWWFHQVPDVPVAVDLYDPFFIENLHYAPALGEAPAANDYATLDLSVCRGDFFLCASPEQRLFYAGSL